MIHKIEHVDDGFVRVHRSSVLTGNVNSMVLPTRQGNLEHWEDTDALAQDMFPHFNAAQLDFLITGIIPEEWDETHSFTAISLDAREA